MDPSVSDTTRKPALRRSARQSSSKLMNYEATPRDPLKRTRKRSTKQPPDVVSGSRDLENGIEDDKSPTKKRRLEAEGDMARGDHNDDMDVQKSEPMEINDNLQMDAVEDCSRRPAIQRPHIDENFLHSAVIIKRCPIPVDEVVKENVLAEGHVASTKPPAQLKAPQKRPDVKVLKIPTMQDYKRKMEAKALSSDNRYVPSVYPAPEKTTTTRQRINNFPSNKKHDQYPKTESKNAVIKERSERSCRGWCPWRWIFTGLLICISSLLALRFIPVLQRPTKGGGHPPRAVKLEAFADQLTLLQAQFPNQRPELWKRSRIHLEKHLKTAQPTEPVSLILTAGLGAERTLRCLAQGLAASFSSALNASVLYIDGAGTAGKDSDQVKLDIDTQLRAAFEGDKPAAVIRRLEELPPGSTLIFYRYCDHENAAYKRAFLLFTVVLPQEEVGDEQSLKEVEERVQDYLREKLVDSNNRVGFNEMDGDKFGGLWSRISHLVLPVVWEKEVEQKGC